MVNRMRSTSSCGVPSGTVRVRSARVSTKANRLP
jgi:hypothetical protein